MLITPLVYSALGKNLSWAYACATKMMNGLKIYLKSGINTVYRYAQLAIAATLLLNAILQLEWIHAPIGAVGINFLAAALLLGGFLLPLRFRRQWRLLPGILIAIGGFVMFWVARGESNLPQHTWFLIMYYGGVGVALFGLAQALLDTPGYVRFSKRGITVKRGYFGERRFQWPDVADVHSEDNTLHVVLKSGKDLVFLPSTASQQMRSRIDQLFRESRRSLGNKDSEDLMAGAMGA